ncbi:MAG: helix-hairpin-helix domain-containing protein [Defluviitaleaceae bacterium]|nr:helix-hairpin-helix domain-containing protein [Defluviitaleaceae bacterium]
MQKITDFTRKHAFFLLGGACIIIAGLIYTACVQENEIVPAGETAFHAADSLDAPENAVEPAETPAPVYIVVHITGAVNSPGVFDLPEGSRVRDALALAGGARDDADLEHPALNLAAPLHDAMRIIIPVEGEEIDDIFISAQAPAAATDGLIDLNAATSTELQTLSGIGPVLAQNIIDFREAQGGFSSVEELIHVSGIGETRLNNLRPHVTVR